MEIKIKQVSQSTDDELFVIYFEGTPVFIHKTDLVLLGDEIHEALFGDGAK